MFLGSPTICSFIRNTPGFQYTRGYSMARKSRKHPVTPVNTSPDAVGYIRVSVLEQDESSSIGNQRLIIEDWGHRHKIVIGRYYIDNGYSGKNFNRPAFKAMLKDILADKVNCVVVKDLSRLGRNYVSTGYYIEIFFPSKQVRFISVNDQIDTINGMKNQADSLHSVINIPILNLFNEQVSVDIQKKVESVLDMKAQQGAFIGPRAPFGYQKSKINHDQLVPDPVAAITVRKIFELAASGTGVTAIVRYLNEKGIPTPIQYARSNGLTGNYDDGNGSWNSRSVKYILTNRTYTGMLIQGKEKRAVPATHEPLVDIDTFEVIQKLFQSKAFNLVSKNKPLDNILKGKVICGCCGGKMQRRRGTGNADWHFFTCITKNRLGPGKCTGMYVREEDIFQAIYRQLKSYLQDIFISDSEYKQEISKFDEEIAHAVEKKEAAVKNAIRHYEDMVEGKIDKKEFRVAQDAANAVIAALSEITEGKATYEKQYQAFRKLQRASEKDIPLSEIMSCIDKIIIDTGRRIVVKWS